MEIFAKQEAGRAEYAVIFHGAQHRFICKANFMCRQARFIQRKTASFRMPFFFASGEHYRYFFALLPRKKRIAHS
ncbi:MAG: hypothetical protein IJ357_02945, partial [Oscillospiraceae bacterium]|nr:hypothetical protein [Oscillospiraceae bacterium]